MSAYFLIVVTKARNFFLNCSYSAVKGIKSGLRFFVGGVESTFFVRRSEILPLADRGSDAVSAATSFESMPVGDRRGPGDFERPSGICRVLESLLVKNFFTIVALNPKSIIVDCCDVHDTVHGSRTARERGYVSRGLCER